VRALRARRLHIIECTVHDDTGSIKAVWFNQPYLLKKLLRGSKAILSGTVGCRNKIQIENPDIEILKGGGRDFLHTLGIIPVYPLTEGIGQKTLRRLVRSALDDFLEDIPETLPHGLLQWQSLPPRKDAFRSIHFPHDEDELKQARKRIAFEEFAALQVNLLYKINQAASHGISFCARPLLTGLLKDRLPFSLTAAQADAVDKIFRRMESSRQMNVLLQGDVGSGKTAVAIYAMLKAVENSRQAALMAPTEILAEQHFTQVQRLVEGFDVPVFLLSAGRPALEKKEAVAFISSGKPCLVIGTHALIGHNVPLADLGLAIVDEQHRFGVNQRIALADKGVSPDLIVMTATPIPRTLALTLYSEFETILLDEVPAGRSFVKTVLVAEENRRPMLKFLQKQLQEGRQAFVVCPHIGAASGVDVEAANIKGALALYTKAFPDYVLAPLHGKMDLEERMRILDRFRSGQIQILVTTTIIEVGVDIPNASVIIIEGADKFGLTQLHQLRGRVGRSMHKSYCFLIADAATEQARQRLHFLESSTNGFQIAERDLQMRGPGEFLGTAQSGRLRLRVGHLVRDMDLLREARQQMMAILEADPFLELPQNEVLKSMLTSRSKKVPL